MRESPRLRRLRADMRAMEKLRAESSILDFSIPSVLYGGPPESYNVRFIGRGFWRPEGTQDSLIREHHEVAIHLSASYPRMMPELAWKTPIFHPNISAGGVVCLGGYSTHWAPSLTLDELCTMLWDMIRYQNFDVESPYNREAAMWARSQQRYRLPIDRRPIRDRLAVNSSTRTSANPSSKAGSGQKAAPAATSAPPAPTSPAPEIDDVVVIDDEIEIVDAQVVEVAGSEDQDIVFLD